ncbi:MAG: penicillin-binding protein activator LpoB [Bacteroidota bacterium]
MSKIKLTFPVIIMLMMSSCAHKITRIDPSKQIDLSGRWNDTDSKLVADEMIKDALQRPWSGNFTAKANRKPAVIVGSIKNKTDEHIDPNIFIKNLEIAFINSDNISVVQSGAQRNELRDERNDQQQFSSEETRKQWGKEKGADFMLNGVISSIIDQYKNQKTVTYQINIELTDLETNEKVWIGEKQIKKFIKN